MELSFKVCALTAAVSLLGACGGSSGGSGAAGGDTSGGGGPGGGDPTPNSLQGQFVDAPVANISYEASPSGLSGRTDADGFFNYQAGDSVTFSVRGTSLPAVPATGIVTISSFDIVSSTDNPELGLNIAILLQTLDEDGDPDNGLQIPTETASTETLAAAINFDQNSGDFVSDTNTTSALTDGDGPLVTQGDAEAHLAEQLETVLLNDGLPWNMYTVGPGEDDVSQKVAFARVDGGIEATVSEASFGGWIGRTAMPGDNGSGAVTVTATGFEPEPGASYRLLYRGPGAENDSSWDVLIFSRAAGGYAYFDNRKTDDNLETTGLFDVGNFSANAGDSLSLLGDEMGGAFYANLTFSENGVLQVTGGSDVRGSFSDTGAWRSDVNADEVFGDGTSAPNDPILGVAFDPEDPDGPDGPDVAEAQDSFDFLVPVSLGEVTLFAHSIKKSPDDGSIEEDFMLGSSNAELMDQIREAANTIE